MKTLRMADERKLRRIQCVSLRRDIDLLLVMWKVMVKSEIAKRR